ncbi:hypothetical protein GA0115240_135232 [Streptomyces sp. DvalAA-14]|uniref:terpene synthase family protein n=1 Tax=unclassified Streptomyces TaxID=2593676 RepID=UPI00081B60EA|nr:MULTISPECIES: hypothetical protein [unclassified Streptomyces]MYS21774.1 hypothetical protein [Streptomyces sp. SID4948]SCE01020.1 hypothetical protein GA0115240_135232 [Streptomyces sp. DvalAA-14]
MTARPGTRLGDYWIPWSVRAPNPNADHARRYSNQWAVDVGLARTPQEQACIRAWDLVELAARTTPDAGPDGLALGACWLAWSGAVDDHLTALPLAEHDAFTERLAEVLTANTGTTADDHPLARTMDDVWQTSQRRMSPDWAVRFRSELIRTFEAMRIEVIQRSTGVIPDFHSYLAARRPSSGTEPFFELAELANGEEIPEHITRLGLVRTLRDLTIDHVCWTNDIISYDRENALFEGTWGLVPVIRNDHPHFTHTQVVDHIVEMVNERARSFFHIASGLPEYAASLNLSETDRNWLTGQVAVLQNWLVGNLDWHCATAYLRYQDHRGPDGSLRTLHSPFAPQPASV